jgi:hypothetical protein
LLLLVTVTGQMWLLYEFGVKSWYLALAIPLCATALLFGLTAWLWRPPTELAPAPSLPPADVPPRGGKTENAPEMKELLREIKGAKELLEFLGKQVDGVRNDLKAHRAFVQRRLRKLRARQRRILHHLEPSATPDSENDQTLDLSSMLDDEQNSLRSAQMRQQLAHVCKDDLNRLLEVVIELLERETATVVDDATKK